MLTVSQVKDAIQKSGVCKDASALQTDVSFVDLGFDSLDLFNIVLELQKVLGREIPDRDIDNLESIDAIVDYTKQAEVAV